MLLTITNTLAPATDLGFVLHKNPANVRSVELSFGTADVFYPEAAPDRCTAALLLRIDPVGLVRRGRRGSFALSDYVNDRPYVASSFMTVALAKVFGTTLSGRADRSKPELADQPLPLEAHLPVVPCRGGEDLVRRLFEPLGYELAVRSLSLDERFPAWGDSRYLDLTIHGTLPARDLLRHLYVLLPVMDDDKHYWVERGEIEKLLSRGGDWLGSHPERDLITRRYLRHRTPLTREALARLLEDDQSDPDAEAASNDAAEDVLEEQVSLAQQRAGAVTAALRSVGARSVVDVGCGDGKLLRALLKDGAFERITGVDVSMHALSVAGRRLHLDTMTPRQRERITLLQSALTYRDRRLEGYDAAVLMEVVEHIDPDRLGAFEAAIFRYAHPQTVIVTTPNAEYNVRFGTLPAGEYRHRDHRFEWTRDGFAAWAGPVADRNGYTVRFLPVGPDDPETGPPTQMAVFSA